MSSKEKSTKIVDIKNPNQITGDEIRGYQPTNPPPDKPLIPPSGGSNVIDPNQIQNSPPKNETKPEDN